MNRWTALAVLVAGLALAAAARRRRAPDEPEDCPISDGWVLVSRTLETQQEALLLGAQILSTTGDLTLAEMRDGEMETFGTIVAAGTCSGDEELGEVWH